MFFYMPNTCLAHKQTDKFFVCILWRRSCDPAHCLVHSTIRATSLSHSVHCSRLVYILSMSLFFPSFFLFARKGINLPTTFASFFLFTRKSARLELNFTPTIPHLFVWSVSFVITFATAGPGRAKERNNPIACQTCTNVDHCVWMSASRSAAREPGAPAVFETATVPILRASQVLPLRIGKQFRVAELLTLLG